MKYETVIALGVLMGTLSRLFLLRVDYRQYPTYPQGYIFHLSLGVVAAALGAVSIPALLEKEYAAVTFLAIAAQHFRDVRGMERDSLAKMEETELVRRGSAYIEDIAKKFESRNYVAIITAFLTSLGIILIRSNFVGILIGCLIIGILKLTIRSKHIKDIAEVRPAEIVFDGPFLKVEGIVFTNVGLTAAKEKLKKQAIACIIIPKDENAMAILSNIGQRQAILHDLSVQLGIRKEKDEPEFSPMTKRNSDTGVIGVVTLAMEKDIECMIEAIRNCPVLESIKRHPLESRAGKAAVD